MAPLPRLRFNICLSTDMICHRSAHIHNAETDSRDGGDETELSHRSPFPLWHFLAGRVSFWSWTSTQRAKNRPATFIFICLSQSFFFVRTSVQPCLSHWWALTCHCLEASHRLQNTKGTSFSLQSEIYKKCYYFCCKSTFVLFFFSRDKFIEFWKKNIII